ncbi:MAG: ABC transporter ATP-binding protein [Tissierellia bacterium]|nr:ABC transporter ATP-binding protein [Tissierellia bacterium]
MIKVENLCVKYGNFTAVNQVSFQVREGEIFGLIGRNGAGKTSVIETLEGLRKRAEGEIRIDGIDPGKPSNKSALYDRIAVQLQDTMYPERARVEELCRLFSSLSRNSSPYSDLLARFGLTEKKGAFVHQLSGGQKQKLSIVLALLSDPKILFLDEITTGLDAHARHEIWDYLTALKEEGMTIILISHFMDDIEATCDRIGIMQKGRLLHLGTQEELTRKSNLGRGVEFVAQEGLADRLKKIPGVQDVAYRKDRYRISSTEEIAGRIATFLQDQNISYYSFATTQSSLEEVFMQLTGEKIGEQEEGIA